jgi:hypothetical protein
VNLNKEEFVMENNIFLYIYVYTKITIMANLKLTTVKVIQKLYDEDFKMATIRGGINFQKLVNRTLDLYTKDEKFRKQLNEYTLLQVSGSQF